MAEAVASLRALLSLDSAAFEKGAKRATAHMSKLQARMHRIGRDMQSVGKKMALGITTPLAAGTAAMVATTTAAAVEIDRLAKVSNSGRTEFQRFSSAAKTVGIEQEKLSDILKDVNDRVGDFVATGGGPMVDFFENIAPKVGVTAAQFEKLSGPDALQLYVSSLEEAGVSQQEMTFYLEAMASDLTLLQPLLANGGKGLKELGDQAERTGAVIDEKTIAALLRAKASMRELGNSVAGIKNQIVSALAPTLESIAEAAKKLANWFATLSPEMKKFAAIAAVVAAALGPVLIAVGFMATGFTALVAPIVAVTGALFTLSLNPIVLTITAVVAGVVFLAKKFYDLVKATGGVRAAFDYLSASVKASFYGLGASILETMGSATGETTRLFIATGAAMSAAISTAISEVVAVISRLPDAAMEVMADFKNSIVNGISDTIADAVAAATKLKNAIKNALKGSNPGVSGGMRGQVKSGASGGASGGWSDGSGLPEVDGGAYGDTLE